MPFYEITNSFENFGNDIVKQMGVFTTYEAAITVINASLHSIRNLQVSDCPCIFLDIFHFRELSIVGIQLDGERAGLGKLDDVIRVFPRRQPAPQEVC